MRACVTRASFGALAQTGRKAARMWACFLTSCVIISRVRRVSETGRQGPTWRSSGTEPGGNAASSGEFRFPTTASLLVHDPSGPARIRHASADSCDIFGEPDMKGDKGGWGWKTRTSRRRGEKRHIEMGEVEEVDRFNGDEVPRVPLKTQPSGIKRRSSEQLRERWPPSHETEVACDDTTS